MPDKPPTTASDFIAAMYGAGSGSEAPVFLCSLPNVRGEGGEKFVVTRDRAGIDGFAAKWDRPGRALYFCTGTIRSGAQPDKPGGSVRLKSNVAEIVTLQSDTDLKSVDLDREGVLSALRGLFCPPSIIVWSGRGAHAYWLLNEALEADPDTIARAEALNAQLADLVAGDAVQDVCRLMRLPGSHNTKEDGWLPVEVVEARYEPRYSIDDLEDWLSWASPAMRKKAKEPGASVPALADNPWLAVAARLGFKPPIDVERRLSAMDYQGVGETSIHQTQIQVSAALLSRGEPVEDVVEVLLEATRVAAGEMGARWNWTREERAIQRMCEDWRRKHPEVAQRKVEAPPAAKPPKAQAREADRGTDEVVREASTGAVVHSIAEERSKREKEAKPKTTKAKTKTAAPVVIADGVVEAIRRDGGDLALTEGEMWFYESGVWTACAAAEEQWLRTLIQTGCDELGYAGDTKTANAAWKRLMEHPGLHQRKVVWDAGGVVATANGMLDLRTRALSPYRPDAWCRSKIGQAYDPAALCPIFLRFLESCFVNLGNAERAAVIATIQEAFGAMLSVKLLVREERKALFVLGPSRTGKTQLSTIARRLIGDPVASPSVADVTGDFGMQILLGSRAWIRDDAVSERDHVDPIRFKVLVTGEAVTVNRKNRTPIDMHFEIPVLLTTNAMPRARDSSEAIYNRCIVIEMTSVVEEHEARAARAALGLPADSLVGEAIAAMEGPGILNWALDGLDRLRARGRYDPPASIREANKRFRDDNNPVAAWMSSAIERDPTCKVSRNDLRCSFNGWQREEMGAEARAWGGRQFFPQVRQLAPYAGMDGQQAHDGERFISGIRMTPAGLRFWEDHKLDPLSNGTKGYSSRDQDVNRRHEAEDTGRSAPQTEF